MAASQVSCCGWVMWNWRNRTTRPILLLTSLLSRREMAVTYRMISRSGTALLSECGWWWRGIVLGVSGTYLTAAGILSSAQSTITPFFCFVIVSIPTQRPSVRPAVLLAGVKELSFSATTRTFRHIIQLVLHQVSSDPDPSRGKYLIRSKPWCQYQDLIRMRWI